MSTAAFVIPIQRRIFNGDSARFLTSSHQQLHHHQHKLRNNSLARSPTPASRHSRIFSCLESAAEQISTTSSSATKSSTLLETSEEYLVSGNGGAHESQPRSEEIVSGTTTTSTVPSPSNDSQSSSITTSAPPERSEEANTLSGSSMLEQMRQIFLFAGPALGIWLSGPIMSLIDTSVVGTSNSLELAALGPGTVMCDGLSYVFMFLSVATSNLIATSLANKNKAEAADHLARLLFVALVCGSVMLVGIELLSGTMLRAFVGPKNSALVPAAASYVNIRALAWPAVLVAMVAQSASLGMQDSWNPLKGLIVASLVNAGGDVLLCCFFKYGIAGAAWATSVSQYVAAIMMLLTLREKGYDPLALRIPRMAELVQMIEIAAPVLLTMLSKVCFYTGITYFATSLGAVTLGAHQVIIGLFVLFSVCGEPLGQTAQSFIPRLIAGQNKSIKQAQELLRSLLLIGTFLGTSLATIGLSVSFVAPHFFTKDAAIVAQMHSVAAPFFCSILLTPLALTLEGTLLASRDYRYLGFSMASCFVGGSLLLLVFHKLGLGLRSCWWILVLFQLTRFTAALTRLSSSRSFMRKVAIA